MFLDRLLDRVKQEKGVSFKEFRDFCQFLNNLEDFSVSWEQTYRFLLLYQRCNELLLIISLSCIRTIRLQWKCIRWPIKQFQKVRRGPDIASKRYLSINRWMCRGLDIRCQPTKTANKRNCAFQRNLRVRSKSVRAWHYRSIWWTQFSPYSMKTVTACCRIRNS